jgi:hypothetical protein
VKRTGRGESIGAVIHICMGSTQGNSLCSYLYHKLVKRHVLPFIIYVFSSTKIGEQESGAVSARAWGEVGRWLVGRSEMWGDGGERGKKRKSSLTLNET